MTLLHDNPVQTVSVSSDGRTLISIEGHTIVTDCATRIWEMETGREVSRPAGHQARSHDLFYLSDGQRILERGNRELKIWDVELLRELAVFEMPRGLHPLAMAISPDFRSIAAAGSSGVFMVPNPIFVWDIASGAQKFELPGHVHSGISMAFTPDGSLLISSGAGDQALRAWSMESGGLQRTWEEAAGKCLAVTPDGRLLISGHNLEVFELETGRLLRSLGKRAQAVAIFPDGSRLVAAVGNKLLVIDIATGQEILALSGHSAEIDGVQILPSGEGAVSCSLDRTVKIWDLAGVRSADQIDKHESMVSALALSPGGKRLKSFSQGSAFAWDCATGKSEKLESICPPGQKFQEGIWEVMTPDRRRAVTFLALRGPDYKGVNLGASVFVWDLKENQLVKILENAADPGPKIVDISPDGARIVTYTNRSHLLKVWDVDRGVRICQINAQGIGTMKLTPDASAILVALYNGDMAILDLETLALVKLMHHGGGSAVITPDGQHIVYTGQNVIGVRDIRSGAVLARYFDEGGISEFATEDNVIAAGRNAGDVLILEVEGMSVGPRIIPVLKEGTREYYRCPYCETEFEAMELEDIIRCRTPECGRSLSLVRPSRRRENRARFW